MIQRLSFKANTKLVLTVTASLMTGLLVSACGGGGGDGDQNNQTQLSVSGVAATGAAMSSATVSVVCASGSGTAQSNNDGSYSVTISSGTWPCVVEADDHNGHVLHSIANGGSGTSGIANVTPITELLIAQATGIDPKSLMSSHDNLSTLLSNSNLAEARTKVVALLEGAGIDTSTLPQDLTGGAFKAATGGVAGDSYDQVLDSLQAKLEENGSSVSQLIASVVASNGGSSDTPTSPTSSALNLPAELLFRQPDSHCPALRTGDYIATLIKPGVLVDEGHYDAATHTFTWKSDNYALDEADVWVPVSGEPCHFKDSKDNAVDSFVSPAGVIFSKTSEEGVPGAKPMRIAMAIPKQTHTLADMAGTWNTMMLERTSNQSYYAGRAGVVTLNAVGAETSVDWCESIDLMDLASGGTHCENISPGLSVMSLNANIGFDSYGEERDENQTVIDHWTDRFFLYQAGNGEKMGFFINSDSALWSGGRGPDGTVGVITSRGATSLPSVGETRKAFMLTLNSDLSAEDSFEHATHTVTAIDANAGTFSRNTTLQSTGASTTQTIGINSQATGFNTRFASSGVRKMVTLSLRGMGISWSFLPATESASEAMIISINR